MDAMLPSRLGKLRILCSLPLFSDAIRIKRQSAAEHGFTEIMFALALAQHLALNEEDACDLVELAIFAELPKAYLGDPSYYLRTRHPEAQKMYQNVLGRLWEEAEDSVGFKTSRSNFLFSLHALIDSFSAMLFIEKESLLGNQYFAAERYKTSYAKLRRLALTNSPLGCEHPALRQQKAEHPKEISEASLALYSSCYRKTVEFLDGEFYRAEKARLELGIGEYSSTYVGMIEKLKEHFRYKGWSYHYAESVGEHTFQVVFLAFLIANELGFSTKKRIQLYRLTAFHDLAEAYASDVIYPVKIREKELGELHSSIESKALEDICSHLHIPMETSAELDALLEICDRFSAQLYFDRERRSGNSHFNVPNTSMERARQKFENTYPEVFKFLDKLWAEYEQCFAQ